MKNKNKELLIILLKIIILFVLFIFAYIDTANRLEILKMALGFTASFTFDLVNKQRNKRMIKQDKEDREDREK